MEYTTTNLMLLRSLISQGWPCEMLDILLRRCGAEQGTWDALEKAGLVEVARSRWCITATGKRWYNKRPKCV